MVAHAEANLATWGIRDRFTLLAADIRRPPPELAGPFHLITLYNHIYYFSKDERLPLLRSLRERLAPKGAVALVTTVRGPAPIILDFDLALKSTAGIWPLPELDELMAQVRDGGFADVKATPLEPLDSFYGLVGRGT